MGARRAKAKTIPQPEALAPVRWPATRVEMRSIESLIPYARNARQHPPEQIAQIVASMKEFGFTVPALIAEDGTLIAGHGRILAARQLVKEGRTEFASVPVMTAAGWTDAQRRAYTIADNRLGETSTWDLDLLRTEMGELRALDFDLPTIGWDEEGLRELFLDPADEPTGGGAGLGSLTARFMVAPFSVLNAREGWWQDRKRAWIALGIESELGRGENALGFSETILNNGKKRGAARTFGQDLMRGEHVVGSKVATRPGGGGNHAGRAFSDKYTGGDAWAGRRKKASAPAGLTTGEIEMDGPPNSGTSIFDPVLCELAYRWFSPPGGIVLDPFAGGSVRGIVASKLGRAYHGVDLRPEQIAANEKQADVICAKEARHPQWTVGDSLKILPGMKMPPADFMFSCPPYGDLEVYSDLPEDLSTLDYGTFAVAYAKIVAAGIERLAANRFACFVVGDFRDERGFYRGFVSDTIDAFEAAGARLYNEIILVTAAGSLPIRAGKQFSTTRKVGKTHQNVLVFCKGDPRKATEACGQVEIDESLFAEAQVSGGDIGATFGERL